ncbi:LysR family transcriptional regulator [Cupriavidus gilardii]|uniref:LysR family transcriptional regulator n=1 Tax=Cupriavidus gilardii TaxID=82541 RepID=UPI001ABED649|nr:LysR family transcriptional regulator [Cupriavidus gilardii]MBO4119634.1 LysR family transcriptional regulator [Cupriavidus gilardii]
MPRTTFDDLAAFIAVARARSFTRAAAQLGVSQSALSQAVRGLEARLGVRLLTRTTRSVSATEAGERLMATVAPRLEEVEAELGAIAELRDEPRGTIRITATEHAANAVLWPRLAEFLRKHPDVRVELMLDNGLSDIAADRYDMGVRLGDLVAKDMVAVRIGPDVRFAVVGSPAYLAGKPHPKTPRDLTGHRCINLYLPTYGGLYAWEFRKGKRELNIRVEGQFVVNDSEQMVTAALAGLGLAFLPEDMALAHMARGRLVSLLEDWCPVFPGYHLYYPSRRHSSRAMRLLIEALRYPAK